MCITYIHVGIHIYIYIHNIYNIYIYAFASIQISPQITLRQSTVAKRMKIPAKRVVFVAIATELVTPLHDVIIQVLSGWWFGTFG